MNFLQEPQIPKRDHYMNKFFFYANIVCLAIDVAMIAFGIATPWTYFNLGLNGAAAYILRQYA